MFTMFRYVHFDNRYGKIRSLMTSQRDVKVGLLYSCLNEFVTFSEIQVAVFSQLSLSLVHI